MGGGWSAIARYRHGWTRVASSGLVSGGALQSNAFSFDLAKARLFSGNDTLAFRFAQPLRVIRGGFALDVPVSYDYASGAASFGERFLGLSPRGRERDYELTYSRHWSSGRIDFHGFMRTDAGNVAGSPRDLGAAIRINFSR